MKNFDLEQRIKELELEIQNLKSKGAATKTSTISETAEREIVDNKERFQNLFNNAPLGYQSLDTNGNFIEVNQQWLDILGYTKDEVIGKWFGDFLSLEHKEGFLKRFPVFKSKGQIHSEFEVVHKNGNKILVAFDGQIGYDLNGDFKQTHCILQDITAKKKADEELIKAKERAEESELRIKLIADNFANVMLYQVALIDETTRKFNYISEVVNKLYDCSVEEAMQNPNLIYGKIHPDDIDGLIEKENEALKNMSVFEADARVISKDGSIRWTYYISKPRMIDGIPCWDGVELDITQRKQMEQDLISSKEEAENANQLKTKFLQNMSHEIRTPLNGIMGFSDILCNPSISDEKRKNYSKIIINSGLQLLRIVDDILEISTLETKQTKLNETEFCLNQLLIEQYATFSLKSEEKDVSIYLKKPLTDKETNIISDKTKLNKILSNLIENAIKFTTRGNIEIGYRIENDLLKLYVKDTGIGISAENQQKIFERFSQEHKDIAGTYGGLGLGLSICKEYAELLGGYITLESQKGNGSTFIVTIPYKPAGDSTPNNINSNTTTSKTDATKTILVAEDEEMNYLYIEALFEIETNCNLIHAKNGREALDICMENQNIDLVLMDIKMPVMNGNEATQKIKERFPNLPVIAQTAYSTESEKAEAMKHGYDDFMSKPLEKDRLFEAINKFVRVK
ncbi:MAG: ATP-binding protein [Bacteroidales bacterium]